jgi:hypothetical protein
LAVRRGARPGWLLAALALAAICLTACRAKSPAPSPSVAASSPPVIDIQETPVAGFAVQPLTYHTTGHFRIAVLSAQCGILYYTAEHSELEPTRPLCGVRIRILADGSTVHTIDLTKQALIATTGTLVTPDQEVMRDKRQPPTLDISPNDAVELDLWFEPPDNTYVDALRVFGDQDPDLQGQQGASAGPPSADITLVGLTGQGLTSGDM